jgi:ParB-like chromosome segregation protein Spo0J
MPSCEQQPVSKVQWIDPSTLRANNYNPNHVAKPEMELLKQSILEDGWTQPIVALPDGEIVDGFHRWTLGNTDAEVQALTDGLVPVVRVTPDPAQQRMATIRHNRARGAHAVLKMADIVAELVELGCTPEEIQKRVGMEPEEVKRLMFRGSKIKLSGAGELSESWKPAPKEGGSMNRRSPA